MKQQFSGALVSCMRREASGHSFAYVRAWEFLDKGADTHLVDMFLNKKAILRHSSKLSPQRKEVLEGCFFDVVEHFGYLWETSRGDERWTELGAIRLGVLKNPSGRARRIGADYMRSVIIESRNCVGRGLRTARQLILGLQAGEKKSPAVRLTLAQRSALKKRDPGATGSSRHPTTFSAYRFEHWEQFNYFYDARQPELKLHNISISAAKSQAEYLNHVVV